MSTLFAFHRHLCAFTLVGALAIEFILVGQAQPDAQNSGSVGHSGLTHAIAKRLLIADTVLGASAGLLLIVGLLRVFYFEKGADYYFHSHAFMAKLSIFIAVGLLSIVPTVEFLCWRKALKAGQAPTVRPEKLRLIKKLLHRELMAVVLILLFAAIMARGGWI